MVEGAQYRGSIITKEAHLQFRGDCNADQLNDEGVHYRTTKTTRGVVGGRIQLGE